MRSVSTHPNLIPEAIRIRIEKGGSINLSEYMKICLSESCSSYYQQSIPFGKEGDFITAPEISQMFGELIGAWCVHMWHELGCPSPFNLVEMGPGRGTMMADILRVASKRPDFLTACNICLIEVSDRLRAIQEESLQPLVATKQIGWHQGVETLSPFPTIVIANEFFDSLPIHQYICTPQGWRERTITFGKESQLSWTYGSAEQDQHIPHLLKSAPIGSIFESSVERESIAKNLFAHLKQSLGAALVIDYGFWGPSLGDTFQAVSKHRFVDPLLSPGKVDLTSHVDFSTLEKTASDSEIIPHGPIPQSIFLQKLGIEFRAQQLIHANPDKAREITSALTRLTSPKEMGTLFQVMAFTSPPVPPPPPFHKKFDSPFY